MVLHLHVWLSFMSYVLHDLIDDGTESVGICHFLNHQSHATVNVWGALKSNSLALERGVGGGGADKCNVHGCVMGPPKVLPLLFIIPYAEHKPLPTVQAHF